MLWFTSLKTYFVFFATDLSLNYPCPFCGIHNEKLETRASVHGTCALGKPFAKIVPMEKLDSPSQPTYHRTAF